MRRWYSKGEGKVCNRSERRGTQSSRHNKERRESVHSTANREGEREIDGKKIIVQDARS